MKYLIIPLFLLLLLLPDFSLAQIQKDGDLIFNNPVPAISGSPSIIIGNILQKALGIIGVIAVMFFIIAGFMWMTAQGDAGKIKKATSIMLWTIIGLLVIFASYALLKFVFGLIK